MKAKNVKAASALMAALKEIPAVRKRLRAKPNKKYYEEIVLSVSAADAVNDVTQGSEAYFHVPANLGSKILDATDRVIRDELKKLGVKI